MNNARTRLLPNSRGTDDVGCPVQYISRVKMKKNKYANFTQNISPLTGGGLCLISIAANCLLAFQAAKFLQLL